MVATAERITPNLQESGFNLAVLPIVAEGFTTSDNGGNIVEADYIGLAEALAAHRQMSVEDIIAHSRTTLDSLTSLFPQEDAETPLRLDHLMTIWDATFHEANSIHSDKEAESESTELEPESEVEVKPKNLLAKIAEQRGRTEEEVLEQIAGAKRFLTIFIDRNTHALIDRYA